jgi:regulator of replication initiation timing
MEQKDEQLHAISNENSELNHQCESFVENTSKLNEENRILKKAVGIQETRLRELQQQTQHMQDVMNQAADYIAGLERTNAALRSRVEADHSSRSSYLPDVPPDVY